MSEPVRLLTLPEVADRLRVSRRTVERLIAEGKLRAIAVGRRRLVTDRELEMYIAGSRR